MIDIQFTRRNFMRAAGVTGISLAMSHPILADEHSQTDKELFERVKRIYEYNNLGAK